MRGGCQAPSGLQPTRVRCHRQQMPDELMERQRPIQRTTPCLNQTLSRSLPSSSFSSFSPSLLMPSPLPPLLAYFTLLLLHSPTPPSYSPISSYFSSLLLLLFLLLLLLISPLSISFNLPLVSFIIFSSFLFFFFVLSISTLSTYFLIVSTSVPLFLLLSLLLRSTSSPPFPFSSLLSLYSLPFTPPRCLIPAPEFSFSANLVI